MAQLAVQNARAVMRMMRVLVICCWGGAFHLPATTATRSSGAGGASYDYREALSKSILFFEGQRSGKLPAGQRMAWRRDSGLGDGLAGNVDLVGGYYDAGDNVKFSFPMAFAATMLSWSAAEYGDLMDGGELAEAKGAIRWATDYLLKTCSAIDAGIIYAQVGDPNSDHACWERPEDMDTPRSVFSIDTTRPGSDLAAEIAAAFAAASLVFRDCDPAYSRRLLATSFKVFDFANTYRGSYSSSLSSIACPYYCSYSGYEDELLWGAAWLYKASQEVFYLKYIISNREQLHLGHPDSIPPFSWDDKHAGVHVLLSEIFLSGAPAVAGLQDEQVGLHFQTFKAAADDFVCSLLPHAAPLGQTTLTPGGLLFVRNDENMQYVTSASFLLLTYGKYLNQASGVVSCNAAALQPHQLWAFAKRQVDYILGDNPCGMSYMVGYGDKYPRHIHHRGSSLPDVGSHPQHVACKDGFTWLESGDANPNVLVGAVVGGPDDGSSDAYADDRSNFRQSEPTLYINAPLIGVLAYLASFSD